MCTYSYLAFFERSTSGGGGRGGYPQGFSVGLGWPPERPSSQERVQSLPAWCGRRISSATWRPPGGPQPGRAVERAVGSLGAGGGADPRREQAVHFVLVVVAAVSKEGKLELGHEVH